MGGMTAALVPYGDREIGKRADSSLGACSNFSAFTWANCERPSGGARQGKGSSEKHGNTYALRQGLFNDGLGERPICSQGDRQRWIDHELTARALDYLPDTRCQRRGLQVTIECAVEAIEGHGAKNRDG